MTTDGGPTQGGTIPPLPEGFSLPFYYGTFTNIGFDYLTDLKHARELLKPYAPHLIPAVFTDGTTEKACLSFNYQMYFAQFTQGAGITQEIELNVVAFPSAEAARTPKVTYRQYSEGQETARRLGFSRVHVACDSEVAIKAGQQLFNEPKFPAQFDISSMPVPNGDAVDWKITCAKDKAKKQGNVFDPKDVYFTFAASLTGLPPRTMSIAPFTEYGSTRKKEKPNDHSEPLAAPLNVFQPYQWYDLASTKGKVTLTFGDDGGVFATIKSFMKQLEKKHPVGAWLYQSPPVAAQNRPYWVSKVSTTAQEEAEHHTAVSAS